MCVCVVCVYSCAQIAGTCLCGLYLRCKLTRACALSVLSVLRAFAFFVFCAQWLHTVS